ncbi:MAG: right-handed parallel beta-helix repeat-containing protein [Candidatus Bathyarchaeota archaeon]|nr:right-handed parallel beta-helix repeat-containing protein [Candidatus Bathyarchaeota archaeon]
MNKAFLLVSIILSTAVIGGFTQAVETSETIYVTAEGSVSPSTANIASIDNVTYIFTNDNHGSIVVQRNDIVLDGAGYTLQGRQLWNSRGIDLTGSSNVSIKNIEITEFFFGIWLNMSTGSRISRNNITVNKVGVWLSRSSNNSISGNNIASNMNYNIYLEYSRNNRISGNNMTAKGKLWASPLYYSYFGIYLYRSLSNDISENNITNNGCGIELFLSPRNNIPRNNIADNRYGIFLWKSSKNTILGNDIMLNDYGIIPTNSSENTICHCNFVNNTEQVHSHNSTNAWDDGYPSGGNYWSDYENRYPDGREMNESGIWDASYVISENNQDSYPLMNPWTPEEESPPRAEEEELPPWMQSWLWAITPLGIAIVAAAVYMLKKRRTASFS